MTILRIRHSVPNYDAWKRAFDNDPAGRAAGGVRRYSVCRTAADANMVVIDLVFDTNADAERFLVKLRALWAGPGGKAMRNPEAEILELVESKDV